ncbi:D-tyrosyl-tRNA(Tyr) deacylase [Candidatus Saccharibacteria bacterium]|nr:D-tyrosyl-tRNA(Tyr) deacylase [Candidatus Saccharibacteria bacterium]
MRAVVQRVKKASILVEGKKIAEIGQGLLVLLGVVEGDAEEQVRKLAQKIADLRIIADEGGKMNLSVRDVKGEVLAVSQFTLLADTSRGHRPSFIKAAEPEKARRLYDLFVEELRKLEIPVKTGEFGEYMEVDLVNDGPVTIILEVPQ